MQSLVFLKRIKVYWHFKDYVNILIKHNQYLRCTNYLVAWAKPKLLLFLGWHGKQAMLNEGDCIVMKGVRIPNSDKNPYTKNIQATMIKKLFQS